MSIFVNKIYSFVNDAIAGTIAANLNKFINNNNENDNNNNINNIDKWKKSIKFNEILMIMLVVQHEQRATIAAAIETIIASVVAKN